jgi:MOSC domain-containing protein YiiM
MSTPPTTMRSGATNLPPMDLPWGMFGENLTISGVLDDMVYIGDQLEVGSAQLLVTEPRMPCYKLGLRFGRDDVLKIFFQSGFSGFYCAVLKEGEVAAGDPVKWLHRDRHEVSVLDITRLEREGYYDLDLLRRAVEVEALSQDWRDTFLKRLSQFS